MKDKILYSISNNEANSFWVGICEGILDRTLEDTLDRILDSILEGMVSILEFFKKEYNIGPVVYILKKILDS